MTTEPTSVRLAVIDVDSGFVRVLTKRLESHGWQYRVLGSVPRVEDLVAMRLNALVVDLGMLGPEAWSFLEQVCTALPGMGVVVCTGRSSVAQRVRGLRLGADDWLTKPCHPEELIARVEVGRPPPQAVGHPRSTRARSSRASSRSALDQFQAFVRGRSIDLTRREFEVLQLLAEANGQVLQREEIYQRVWGYAMARGDRSVDVFVRKVRQKLESASPDWEYIHTHFGIGYRFEPQSEQAEVPVPAASTPPERQPTASAQTSLKKPPRPSSGQRAHGHLVEAGVLEIDDRAADQRPAPVRVGVGGDDRREPLAHQAQRDFARLLAVAARDRSRRSPGARSRRAPRAEGSRDPLPGARTAPGCPITTPKPRLAQLVGGVVEGGAEAGEGRLEEDPARARPGPGRSFRARPGSGARPCREPARRLRAARAVSARA